MGLNEMKKIYNEVGIPKLIPESVREAVLIKYNNQLFYLDMIDYQTADEKARVREITKHLKQLEALL